MMSNEFELPTLEQIEQMEIKRQQAIDSLQINETDKSVTCQSCGNAVTMIPFTRSKNHRVINLQTRIRSLELNRYRGNVNTNEIKALQAELAQLLEEDAQADRLRRLPLYSCRITDWKFVCSSCYDILYSKRRRRSLS